MRTTTLFKEIAMPLHPDLEHAYAQLCTYHDLKMTDLDTGLARVAAANAVVRAQGLESGHLAYLTAIVYAVHGRQLDALGALAEALRRDPMQPLFHQFRSELLGVLAADFKSTPCDAPHLTAWYKVLVAEGAADPDIHLVWAKHLLASGSPESALRVLDALAVLAPAAASVAAVRAEAYEAAGKVDAARACREGVTEPEGDPGHFGYAHA
jgi:tetratricopeptide (TPR) repeat protein